MVRARPWRAAQATAVPRARLEKRVAILGREADDVRRRVAEVAAGGAPEKAAPAAVPPSASAAPAPASVVPKGVPLPAAVTDDPLFYEKADAAARDAYERLWRAKQSGAAPSDIDAQLAAAKERCRATASAMHAVLGI